MVGIPDPSLCILGLSPLLEVAQTTLASMSQYSIRIRIPTTWLRFLYRCYWIRRIGFQKNFSYWNFNWDILGGHGYRNVRYLAHWYFIVLSCVWGMEYDGSLLYTGGPHLCAIQEGHTLKCHSLLEVIWRRRAVLGLVRKPSNEALSHYYIFLKLWAAPELVQKKLWWSFCLIPGEGEMVFSVGFMT